MTTLTFFQPYNMFHISNWIGVENYTPTRITITSGNWQMIYIGNFNRDIYGDTHGTLREAHFQISGRTVFSLTDGDINARQFERYLGYSNAERVINYVLEGADRLIGSSGADTLRAHNGDDNISGGAGNDILMGENGNDYLNGGTGIDMLYGGQGDDTYVVDDQNDRVSDSSSPTSTYGDGTDIVHSYIAHSSNLTYVLAADIENGWIRARGRSNMEGNERANIIYAGYGNNYIDGDLGIDTVDYSRGSTGGVAVDLRIITGQNTRTSGTDTLVNIENLTGTGYGDRLQGSSLDNIITGGRGNDRLYGHGGNDTLRGDTGNDWLDGGQGHDTLYGGLGADQFRFTGTLNEHRFGSPDHIADFDIDHDFIGLGRSTFSGLSALNGVLQESQFALRSWSHSDVTAGTRVIYDTGNGGIYYDPDGTGSAAAILLATIADRPVLSHTHFLLV